MTFFNRSEIDVKVGFITIIFNVYSYCSMKNNVLLFIFRPFRTDNRIRSSRLEASGVLIA